MAEKIFGLVFNNSQKPFSNDDFIIRLFRNLPLSVSDKEMRYWNDSFELLEKWVEMIQIPNKSNIANELLMEFRKMLLKTERNNEQYYKYVPQKQKTNEMKEKKLNQLVNNFETLLKNFEKNKEYFSEIIGKVSKYDVNKASEMWMTLLEDHSNRLSDTDYAYFLCGSVCYEMEKEIDDEDVCLIFKNNPQIMYYFFSRSVDVYVFPIIQFLKYGFLKEAMESFDMEMNNNNKLNSDEEIMPNDDFIIEVLEDLSDGDTLLSEEGIEVVKKWAERVVSEENKAKASICIMNLEEVFEANIEYDEEDDDWLE